MEIYLVRHTKPLIGKDVCYGQTDIAADPFFFKASADNLLSQLPANIDMLYSSPLIRCGYLANYIKKNKYQNKEIEYSDLLKEVHFGDWENKKWDDINQTDLQAWMNDFVNQKPPGGESFIKLHQRTNLFLDYIRKQSFSTVVVITHAGVIRSLICHIEQTELKDAFTIECEYGSLKKPTLQ